MPLGSSNFPALSAKDSVIVKQPKAYCTIFFIGHYYQWTSAFKSKKGATVINKFTFLSAKDSPPKYGYK